MWDIRSFIKNIDAFYLYLYFKKQNLDAQVGLH